GSAERRLARLELLESEQRLRAVMADQTDLICRFEPNGILTFVNAAFCRFHQRAEKELLGDNFFLMLEDTEIGKLKENLQKLPEENPVLSFDQKASSSAGHQEWHQ